MTTSVLDRVPVDDITAQARKVRTGRALLALVAALFFAVGWLAGRVVPVLMWCAFAVREGYRSAHGPSRKMQVDALTARVQELEMQLSRFSG